MPLALRAAAVVAVLCGVLLAEAAWVRRTKSVTFDETFYLSGGLQSVRDGRLDPRLAESGVAPLPVLLTYVVPLAFAPREDRPEPWVGRPGDARLIDGPRLANAVLCGVPLVVATFVWLLRRRGPGAAATGASVVAFSPTVVAHASLATTEACFALVTLLALAVLIGYLRTPTRPRLVLLAVAIAAAMAAKYSGVFLLPVAAASILFLRPKEPPPREDAPPSSDPGVAGAAANADAPDRTDPLDAHEPLVRSAGRGLGRSAPATPGTRGGRDEPRSGAASDAARGTFKRSLVTLAALGCLVVPFWWGFHLFTFAGPLKTVPVEATPDSSPWVRVLGRGPVAVRVMDAAHRTLRRPAPVAGVLSQSLHNGAGHPAFLMGRRSETGWWHYFPCAFAFKSTPPELILAAGLLAVAAFALRRPRDLLRSDDVEPLVLALAVGVYAVLMLTSRINIGHRYLLPLYPILAIAGTDCLFAWLSDRPRWRAAAAVALVAGQAAANALIAPDFLAYFNGFAGGPERGRNLLVDSNLDWGQDLPALRAELDRRPGAAVALSYFGSADPAGYGVEADGVLRLSRPPDDYDVLAVSATHLQGVYVPGDDPFRDVRRLAPDATAGPSILVYDLDSPEKRLAFRRAIERLPGG